MKEHFQGLGHIAVYTKNMEESIAFYQKLDGSLLKRDAIHTPAGDKLLALVDFAGVTLELIQSPTPVSMEEGNLPHFAIYVDDVDAAAAAIRAAGVDTFTAPEKKVLPSLFGGLENRFFTGPSGEQIELLRML
jgi:lactoylglutathione lyase